MEPILELAADSRIAESKFRHCYLHPEDHNRIIKIIVHPDELSRRLDGNMKEWKYYQRLKAMKLPLDFIPPYYGFIDTNLGRGLVSQCVRDFDGQVSPRLAKVLDQREVYNLAEVENKIKELSGILIKYNIQLFDLNRFNILVKTLENGSCQPMLIDLKGPYNNYEFIPVSTYLPYFSRKKLRRRCQRLLDMIIEARS
ncbi:MAG: hypothetical protein CSB24_01505 [Deltaproteobacteria bacterium]|nr:MAG: hypothetical protein CSB24_01505 [Deltaproteobacteria bacterium]